MNPPYSSGVIDNFCYKLLTHLESGDVTQAIVLVNNATETAWFQSLLATSHVICFPQGRISFVDPEGNSGNPLQGQVIMYFGRKHRKFVRVFGKFGVVYGPAL